MGRTTARPDGALPLAHRRDLANDLDVTQTEMRTTPWYRHRFHDRWRRGVVGGTGPLVMFMASEVLDKADGSKDLGVFAWSAATTIGVTVLVAVILAKTEQPVVADL